ncbi:MAG TPA: CBS domain-containing protein [Anaerolineales bacterium]|nr:CBS domain-containing protein [Anaerolineales bacterium]
MSDTIQELYGRKGRNLTDREAQEITRVEELSYELKIQDVMSREIKSLGPSDTMQNVFDLLRQNRISGAPVLEDNSLIGIISQEDLMRALAKGELSAPIREYMTTKVITVKSYEPVVKALEVFTRTRIGRLPVVDENEKLAGMITKGDITRGVLVAIRKDYHDEEIRRYRASHLFEDIISDRTSLILRYKIRPRDFTNGGQASSYIKRALLRLGASPQLARECGIAVYEAEMNLIIHATNGGVLRVQIEPHRILMQTSDDGPGIPDVKLALQPGWSTASEFARSMGFGAGMGLVNIQRCVNKMEIDSTPGKGTKLLMEIHLSPDEKFKAPPDAPEAPGV